MSFFVVWSVWMAFDETEALAVHPAYKQPPPTKVQKNLNKKAHKLCKRAGKHTVQCWREKRNALVINWNKKQWKLNDRDMDRALRAAAKHYGVSYRWLRNCNRSEGGAGPWKWNGGYYLSQYPRKPRGSSGAGGWMQFMSGTFYGYIKRIHHVVPKRYRKWKKSRVGHAYTAAYMFSIGESKQWTGRGC